MISSENRASTFPDHALAALVALFLGVLFLLVGRSRRRGGIVRQAVLDLGLDLRQVFRLRLQIAGMRPLEFRFQRAADTPIGIAEMVVDGGILGFEIDRAL